VQRSVEGQSGICFSDVLSGLTLVLWQISFACTLVSTCSTSSKTCAQVV